MADYLTYWKFHTVAQEKGIPLEHAASEQYGKIAPGDILWFVTYEGGTLALVGRMEVARVVGQHDAERLLQRDTLWEATYHVLATPGTAALVTRIPLMDAAPALRFEGGVDRLPPHFTAQSFRGMRRLTKASASLLSGVWLGDSTEQDGTSPAPTVGQRAHMDPSTILKIGNPYTRDEIHDLLGGDKQSYLPHVGGRIVGGCFDLALNKAAPIEIDVGNAPKVLECARLLVQAGNAIPVFLKERVKRWRYEGMYQPVAFEEDVNQIRAVPYRRRDAVGVLYLEPWDLRLEEGPIPDIDGAHYTASEGHRTLALHYRRERNRPLVEAKKRAVEAEKGYLACEVCDVDFHRLSPRYGMACCEIHHLRPLALGPTEGPTRLSDLAIVCSNCHRMIHRLAPPLTVARLRQELSTAS